jgi:P4 family phage/plasmid primase-like protien
MSLLSEAVAYAKRGWRVFPIQPGSKEPYPGSAGFKDASSDPEVVRDMWVEHPDANIGLATGPGSGVYVVDVDEGFRADGSAKVGETSWEALEAQHGEAPVTLTALTPNGGRHLFYQYPEDAGYLGNTAGKLGKDVDTRGDGGYVLLAPSEVDGKDYQWLAVLEVAPLPTWVVSGVVKSGPAEMEVRATWERDDTEVSKYVLGVVDREVEGLSAAPEGTRNDHLNRSAFALGTLGGVGALEEEWARAALMEAAQANGHLSYADGMGTFLKTFSSGWNSGMAKPRSPWPPKPRDDGLEFEAPKKHPDPSAWFDKEGLLAYQAAAYVFKMGPLAQDRTEEFWAYEHGVWKHRKNEVKNRVVAILKDKFRNSHLTNIQAVVSSRTPVIGFEPIPEVINCKSGLLDWRTGEVSPHDPATLSTVQLPWEWDPEAQCPAFDKFLSEVFPADILPMIWEFIGYMLYSGNPLQVAFLMHGKGSNGKGTLIRVLKSLLGQENITAASLNALASDKFAVAELAGKIANLAGDIDATYQESTAQFKAITGEDVMYAQRKFGHPFTFTSYAVPVFSANKIPGSADTSEGYRRRWVVLPFGRTFTGKEKDPHLSDRLAAEAPGIAAHAVASLRDLMNRGYFEYGDTATQAQEMFARSIDVVREWIHDACDDDAGAWTPRSVLYQSFRAWCMTNGSSKPMKSSNFYERLDQAGYRPSSRRDKGRGYNGIYVREMRMQGRDGFISASEMSGMDA